MKMGVPPTLLKARTGELTPPGILRWALSNNSLLLGYMRFLLIDLASAVRDYWFSNFTASFAKYVAMRSAPARFMEVSVSNIAFSSSIQPIFAAALIIAYSPLIL